jgi:hypothetical protein
MSGRSFGLLRWNFDRKSGILPLFMLHRRIEAGRGFRVAAFAMVQDRRGLL